MDNKEVKLLLKEAVAYRDYLDYPQAIANMHQAVNAFPENKQYLYLLASFYLEAQNIDAATKYANEILQKDNKYKEAIELKGLIAEAEKRYKEAEKYYLKCLEIDPNFHQARFNLIQLYANCFFPERVQGGYRPNKEVFDEPEKIIENGKYLHENNTIDPTKKKKDEYLRIARPFGFTCRLMSIAYYELGNYEEAIKIIEKRIAFSSLYNKIFPGFFLNDETNIFKLYYFLDDKRGMEKYKEIMKSAYQNEEKFIESLDRKINEAKEKIIYL